VISAILAEEDPRHATENLTASLSAAKDAGRQ
jgi:hypothetical protein